MNSLLKYEIQKIDGTPSSVQRAFELIQTEFKDKENISRSTEAVFFEELTKCIIEWVASSKADFIKNTFQYFDSKILGDVEMIEPYIGSNSKKRFASQLSTLNNFLEIYLRSDLIAKDYLKILSTGKVYMRLRVLIPLLFKIGKPTTINDLLEFEIYTNKSSKLIERDLNELAELGFLKKVHLSKKSIVFELTPKAFVIKDKIENLAEIKPIPVLSIVRSMQISNEKELFTKYRTLINRTA